MNRSPAPRSVSSGRGLPQGQQRHGSVNSPSYMASNQNRQQHPMPTYNRAPRGGGGQQFSGGAGRQWNSQPPYSQGGQMPMDRRFNPPAQHRDFPSYRPQQHNQRVFVGRDGSGTGGGNRIFLQSSGANRTPARGGGSPPMAPFSPPPFPSPPEYYGEPPPPPIRVSWNVPSDRSAQ